MALTKKQKAVYDFIRNYCKENGIAPTQREILEHFGFKSFGSVQRYITYLIDQGYMKRDWNARRGLKVIEQAAPSAMIPLLGRVAAGKPIEAIETSETVSVPRDMLRGGEHFVLTVSGHSMIEDGILDGDRIIVRKQAIAELGDTVVALVENEATVKRYHPTKQGVELLPANQTMQPILVKGGEFRILGVVIGLLRYYNPPSES